MPKHHSSLRKDKLDKDANKQQKRRDGLKAAGIPTTHVVNRAVTEGLMYFLDAERAKGATPYDAVVSVNDILAYATVILSRHTNGTDQYQRNGVHEVLVKRIGKLSRSKFRMPVGWPTED